MSRQDSNAAGRPNRPSLYREITETIIEQLQAGRVPWTQPWGAPATKAPLGMPHNAATGRRYGGINVLLLWQAVIEQGFAGQSWLTYRQARSLGGNVRKGERGTTIVYADRFVPPDERRRAVEAGEDARAIPFLKRFSVFNTDQCENLPPDTAIDPPATSTGSITPQVETLAKAIGVDFHIGGDLAFYSPSRDRVQVPPQRAFPEPVNWHQTAWHELSHATGHFSRLGRDLTGAFGSRKYAFEELIAEISCAFCCATLGIMPSVRHADYIGSWVDVLDNDHRAIVRAASRASKAADYLLAFLPQDRRPEAREADATRRPASGLSGNAAEKEGRSRLRDGLEAERVLSAPVAETAAMATASHICLSSARNIPFDKLVLSQSNVRRIKTGVSIEELAEDIARRTLLQSLNVRPILDASGAETGMFEIPAGGRRYRALELLVEQKRLARNAPVPCVVRDPASDVLAEDDSLAENVQRAPLHPLDQFRAFQTMRDKGCSEEDIAAAFFTSVNVVKQRLRLAGVSPKLLDVYAGDGMSLEQLMAFTVSGDHARQEQVWETISGSWSKEPHQIRRMLTEETVRVTDRRAVFVGVGAYEAAGGVVLRDLFQRDDGGWLEDVALLERLVAQKLRAEAEKIAAEGWKWIAVAVDFPYGHAHGLRALNGVATELTRQEQATIDALNAEYARLEIDHSDAEELPEAVDQRLGEIETVLAALNHRPVAYDPADVARAGAFVSIGADGRLAVDRGYVRPQDEAPACEPAQEADGDIASADQNGVAAGAPTSRRAVITINGRPDDADDGEGDTVKPLSDRLVMELSAHRTLALRDAVARNPQVALTALLHKLVVDTFQRTATSGGCLEASVRHVFFPVQAADLKDSPSARSICERQEAWKADLPQDDQELWDWLAARDEASRLSLLAHCVSFGINALYEKPSPHGGSGAAQHGLDRRLGQAERLARATGLDMAAAGWAPTVDNYLGRVPKRRILEAAREGAGEHAAQLIGHLKKADMAREAERLLADTGWLPEPLRFADAREPLTGAADGQGEAVALPDFLVVDDRTCDEEEADRTPASAAK